ncbi:glutamate racemase [Desulfobaculum bizertense]|uniref:Glutamate racemase n=1 Tax=Desulfobaculum bizertense DSM 18034 TaxID=1121442 RepID=A0A1T4WV24_9BACT|nr:glutamate racemase [Desulfobaculum bizertense]UIJ38625.1 glutamate racemase [Desulfobaculum bizertense]SKA81203.1 glutamate racemase [Desulfobaculum bizertense DSM 18034]
MDRSQLPIGLFDSGVGGLTVLKAIQQRLPNEDLIYLGDTARLPYGTKGPNTISKYALQCSARLVERGIKALVIACNTVSSVALQSLREAYPGLPVIGVIQPGAKAGVQATQNGRIAVLATIQTINGKAYQKAITTLMPEARVMGVPCSLFVALAEEGWTSGPLVEGIAARYLDPVFASSTPPDSVVLGCTHFPLLKDAIQNVVGKDVHIVDSAATTAEAVDIELHRLGLNKREGCGKKLFLATDDVSKFTKNGGKFLGSPIPQDLVELVNL